MKTAIFLAFLVGAAVAAPPGVEIDSSVFYLDESTPLFSNYPATFPYENDKYPTSHMFLNNEVFDQLHPGTNDIGGYGAITTGHCHPFQYRPFGSYTGGASPCAMVFWRLYFTYWELDYTEIAPHNCTSSGLQAGGPYPGMFTGTETVCEPSACCSYVNGWPMSTTEWDSQTDKWNQRAPKYGCKWLSEETYCFILFFSSVWCGEYWDYPENEGNMEQVRVFVRPCVNIFSYFLSQCSGFKSMGAKPLVQALALEPDDYIAKINADEANTIFAIFYSIDHICTPSTEIHPDIFLSADAPTAAPAPTAAGTPAAPSPTAAPATDSAASAMKATFAGVAGLFALARLF